MKKKEHFFPPNLEVKWHEDLSWHLTGEKPPKLVVGINERSNVGSGLVPCHIIRSLALCPQSTLHLSFRIINSLVTLVSVSCMTANLLEVRTGCLGL